MNVYAIIINWNGWQDTIACVDSLLRLDSPYLKVIIVDNASTDGSLEELKKYLERAQNNSGWKIIEDNFGDIDKIQKAGVIRSKFNRGFSGGNNLGMKLALKDKDAGYFWILNNDTVVEKEALNELMKKCAADGRIGICGSRLVYFSNRRLIQAYGGCKYSRWFANTSLIGNMACVEDKVDEDKISRQMDFVVGASMFVTRSFVEEIGMMDENFFLYYEDYDWAKRALGKFQMAYCDRSVVYHKEGASIGGSSMEINSKSITADYYYLRSKLLITKKHFLYAYPVVLAGLSGSMLKRVRRGQFNRLWLIIKIAFYSIFKKDKIFI